LESRPRQWADWNSFGGHSLYESRIDISPLVNWDLRIHGYRFTLVKSIRCRVLAVLLVPLFMPVVEQQQLDLDGVVQVPGVAALMQGGHLRKGRRDAAF
jgi:hypothetical protein